MLWYWWAYMQRPRVGKWLLKANSRVETNSNSWLLGNLTTMPMSHLAINWIMVHWRATNQDDNLIEIMLHGEQLKEPETLYSEQGRRSWGGGGRLSIVFRHCKGSYVWEVKHNIHCCSENSPVFCEVVVPFPGKGEPDKQTQRNGFFPFHTQKLWAHSRHLCTIR